MNRSYLYLACWLMVLGAVSAQETLPQGAIGMMGSYRWRHVEVNRVSIHPKGQTLTTVSSLKDLRVWSIATGKITFQKQLDEEVTAVHTLPDDRILLGMNQTLLTILDPKTDKLTVINRPAGWEQDVPVQSLASSANTNLLAMGMADNSVVVCNLENGAIVRRIENPNTKGDVEQVYLSRDGRMLVARIGQIIRVWDTGTGKRMRTYTRDGGFTCFAVSPNEKLLATGSKGCLEVYEFDSEEVNVSIECGDQEPKRMQYFPEGDRLVVVTDSDGLIHWQPKAGKPHEQLLETRDLRIRYWDIDSSAKLIAMVDETRISLIEANTGRRLVDHSDDEHQVTRLHPRASDQSLLLEDSKGGLTRWHLTTGKRDKRIALPYQSNTVLALNRNQTWAVIGHTEQRSIIYQEIGKAQPLWKVEGHPKNSAMFAISPDDQVVATIGDDDIIYFRDLKSSRILKRITTKDAGVNIPQWSPDGRFFSATVPASKSLVIWEMSTMQERCRISIKSLSNFHFSTDSRSVAIACNETGLHVYDTLDGRLKWYDSVSVHCVRWNRSNSLLVAGTKLGHLRLFDAVTGKLQQQIKAHEGLVEDIAFSPMQDHHLISAGNDTNVIIWDLQQLDRAHKEVRNAPKTLELSTCWSELGSVTSNRLPQLMRTMLNQPEATVTLLSREMQPTSRQDLKEVPNLIEQLDANDYNTRQKARQQLRGIGEPVRYLLQERLNKSPSTEMRQRLEELLQEMETLSLEPNRLRQVRAIELLERIGSAEARQLLEQLAKGFADDRQTREAQNALRRMGMK